MTEDLIPRLASVETVKQETPDIVTLHMEFLDEEMGKNFTYRPGQFVELTVPGVGESTFVINSLPNQDGIISVSVKKVGKNTSAIHTLREGDLVGLRGPYGNGFPMDEFKGKDLFIIGGGIGMSPLRPVINYVLEHRDDYGQMEIVYGSRTPRDLVFRDEFTKWAEAERTRLTLTVDVESPGWDGNVGFVPDMVLKVAPDAKNRLAITCGPPIMIRFTLANLKKLGFDDENIVTTLEMNMKCGVGKCGRCNMGGRYVCKDGPVFRYSEIKETAAAIL